MKAKKMKLALVIAIATAGVFTPSGHAQVTIGSESAPHPGALLDLKQLNDAGATSTKGLLLPRVNLENAELLQLGSNPAADEDLEATGMIVWNTNPYAPTLEGVGTYQWDGEKWCSIKTEGRKPTPPPTGKLAYRNSPSGAITGYLDFLTFNLGADPSLSITQQLLTSSPITSNTTPYADESAAAAFTAVYGSLYQWGRATDGHQNVWSATYTGAPATTGSLDDNGQIDQLKDPSRYGAFIKNSSSPKDWLVTQNDVLWWEDGARTVNDPCPDGFRIPAQDEWESIANGKGGGVLSTGSTGSVNKWLWVTKGTYPSIPGIDLGGQPIGTSGYLIYPPKSSVSEPSSAGDYEDTPALFLPAAGYRDESSGTLYYADPRGYYWSSTVHNLNAYVMNFFGSDVVPNSENTRAYGLSVRCLKE